MIHTFVLRTIFFYQNKFYWYNYSENYEMWLPNEVVLNNPFLWKPLWALVFS